MGTEEEKKSEITNLPEGMSSEELDKFTTGEDAEQSDDTNLAQEALDATDTASDTEEKSSPAGESVETDKTETEEAEEETSVKEKSKAEEKPEVDPKDAVIGDFRRKLRDSELETARLQGEVEARKAATEKPIEAPEKSPLEIAEAAYIEENGNLEGFAMNGKLYREQRAFDDKQVATKVASDKKMQVDTTAIQAESELQEGELSPEKMGQGLDLQSVAAVGEKHLTRGDRLDISDIAQTRGSKVALKEAYKIMVRRINTAGGEDAKLLQNAINAKGKSKSQTKPEKQGKTDIDALTTEGEDTDTGEAETETHSKRLTDFIFTP